jgi:hypothetical protein
MKVVKVERTGQDYHDGDSVWTGWVVVRWDGETESAEHFDTFKNPDELPAVDADAAAEWNEHRRDVERERAVERAIVAAAERRTDAFVSDIYLITSGTVCRVIRGRKATVGTRVSVESRAVASQYKAGVYSVRFTSLDVPGEAGWIDTENLERIPGVPDESFRCHFCQCDKPAASFVWSAWELRQERRIGIESRCVECEAGYSPVTGELLPGTDAHMLAVAVLKGDTTAVLPLIDELIEMGRNDEADTLKRLHKLEKPQRKPRKAKAVAG